MILRFNFTTRVYCIVYFVSCQKNIFDNLACSSPVIITEGAASVLIVVVLAKSVT